MCSEGKVPSATLMPLIASLAVATMLGGCGNGSSAAATAPAPAPAASSVQNAVPEAQLTTVKLTPEAVQRLGLTTTPVERRAVPATVVYGGELMSPPGQRMTVTAPLSGMIAAPPGATFPSAGVRLRAGATVLRIVPLPATADLLSLQESVALRRAQLARTTGLLAAGGASQEELEVARVELARAEAAIRISQGGPLAADDLNTNALALTTPASAELHALYVAPGQVVAAGAPLFDLVGTNALWVRVPVYPGAVAGIDPGATANVAPLSAWSGAAGKQAQRVSGPATADAGAVSSDLYYALSGTDITGFRVGERVRVTLELGSSGESLAVPESAIWRDINGGAWVYVQKAAGTYARARVDLERISGGVAALRRGPAVGTPVVNTAVAELAGAEFGVDH
jgi:membrane fusion protein, heavy metal efflux system